MEKNFQKRKTFSPAISFFFFFLQGNFWISIKEFHKGPKLRSQNMSDTRSNTSRDSQDSKFSKILEEIKNDPKLVKSHRFKMKKYNDVITAKDLISWLIQKNYCKNRNLAISLIQEMLENQLLKLIVSVRFFYSFFKKFLELTQY